MGYRFNIESANIVANLTCGRVYSCYDGIYCSLDNYYDFLYFLKSFEENFYSYNLTPHNKFDYHDDYRTVRNVYERINDIGYIEHKEQLIDIEKNQEILKLLSSLSRIFDKCRLKALLLPSFKNYNCFMIQNKTLKRLLELHPYDSCLILQPKEPLYRDDVIVFDAFPNFDVALKQIDKWPAVMFWDGKGDFAFVPIDNVDELMEIFTLIKYERGSLERVKRHAYHKSQPNCCYYFHLSDLHFGDGNLVTTERRLRILIEKELNRLSQSNTQAQIDFIVTGDAVDSPNENNNTQYLNFSDFLSSKSGKDPIFVLGNHDVNWNGLAFFRRNQTLANMVGHYPKVYVDENLKVIFLLFNSNTNGVFAQGKIGSEQMSEMGNILDRMQNLNDYKLIAVLHHHLLPINQPDCFDDRWYKKIISTDFFENTLVLIDSGEFIRWLQQRNVKLVLHGHKHIPFIHKCDGITVIACGSSTSKVVMKNRNETFLSYNVLKFTRDNVVCTQVVEQFPGAGPSDNYKTSIIPY